MANSLHCKRLREGPQAWNAWREAHSSIIPDLEAIELSPIDRQISNAHGVAVNLSRARLMRADLSHASLIGADLRGADFEGASLANAKLNGADLGGADLTDAVLDDADFSGANIHGAIVIGASLLRTNNLTQAQLDSARGDRTTALPAHVSMPASWLEREHPAARVPAIDARLDLYAVLGVGERASGEDVDNGYRARALIHHPDRNPGDPEAEARFKVLSHAADVLRDPEKRERYDRSARYVTARPALIAARPRKRLMTRQAFAYYVLAPLLAGTSATLVFLSFRGIPVATTPAPALSTMETGSVRPAAGTGNNSSRSDATITTRRSPVAASDGASLKPGRAVEDIGPSPASPKAPAVKDATPVEVAALDTAHTSYAAPEVRSPSAPATAIHPWPTAVVTMRITKPRTSVPSSWMRNISLLRKLRDARSKGLPPLEIVTAETSLRNRDTGKTRAPGHVRSDLPFVAPSCELTPACRANLEMCSC